MNLCVLILSTQDSSFQNFKRAIRQTWALELKCSKIDYFFYEGNYNENHLDGDTIKLKCKDDLKNVYVKFYEALKYLKLNGYNYDCYFRTNLSSYIDVKVFKEYLIHYKINSWSYIGINSNTRILTEFLYSFKISRWLSRYIWAGGTIQFKSGAGFFIGNELISILLETPKSKINFLDDVMIGYLLKGVIIHEAPVLRFDIKFDNSHKVEKIVYKQLVSFNYLFHYRLKNFDRSYDVKMFYLLNDEIQRFNICTL